MLVIVESGAKHQTPYEITKRWQLMSFVVVIDILKKMSTLNLSELNNI
jgi:hypothetical protein